ncbi:MAG: hypothetical protein CSA07_03830 [Bacteroidia bacterium]|nr:MAG: hypothetical protein CSA07_03830 [Bacteroidia bacterium]
MRRALFALLLLLALPAALRASLHSDRVAYREQYKDWAIEQMKLHGVPASITLAQGMLESGNGKSRLATQGHNHFGIKCHGWKGGKMYHDDDQRGECFRVYRSARNSFEDHSLFLRGAKRYAFLFDLPITDYKAWARGLKRAGYATDRRYAERLIEIIEQEGLSAYDRGVEVEVRPPSEVSKPRLSERDSKFVIRLDGDREVYTRNRIDYIKVGPHDTYASLTRRLDMLPFELQRYNELPSRQLPPPGTELYIQPKRRKAAHGNQSHVVEEGETVYSISQKYGMKTKWLRKRNHLAEREEPTVGQILYLRGYAPKR